jgi:hypothetical protein
MRGVAIAFVVTCPASLLFDACRTATEVTIDIRYEGSCSERKNVAILVGEDPFVIEDQRIPQKVFSASTYDCTSGEIGTLVVTPNGNSTRGAVVVIAGIDRTAEDCKKDDGYFGCIIARRTFSFEEHTALLLPILLEIKCKNVPCNAVSTCKAGSCVSSEAQCQGTTCAGFGTLPDGGDNTVDAPTSSDAVASQDANHDAIADAPTDAKQDAEAGPGQDAGVCTYVGPTYCPPYGASTTTCSGTSCFFVQQGAGFDFVPQCATTGAFRLTCASKRNCSPTEICGWTGSNFTNCLPPAACTPPACQQACERTCDCPPSFECAGSNDMPPPGGPPFLRVCKQNPSGDGGVFN